MELKYNKSLIHVGNFFFKILIPRFFLPVSDILYILLALYLVASTVLKIFQYIFVETDYNGTKIYQKSGTLWNFVSLKLDTKTSSYQYQTFNIFYLHCIWS
jgi:hypothetical protein